MDALCIPENAAAASVHSSYHLFTYLTLQFEKFKTLVTHFSEMLITYLFSNRPFPKYIELHHTPS